MANLSARVGTVIKAALFACAFQVAALDPGAAEPKPPKPPDQAPIVRPRPGLVPPAAQWRYFAACRVVVLNPSFQSVVSG